MPGSRAPSGSTIGRSRATTPQRHPRSASARKTGCTAALGWMYSCQSSMSVTCLRFNSACTHAQSGSGRCADATGGSASSMPSEHLPLVLGQEKTLERFPFTLPAVYPKRPKALPPRKTFSELSTLIAKVESPPCRIGDTSPPQLQFPVRQRGREV